MAKIPGSKPTEDPSGEIARAADLFRDASSPEESRSAPAPSAHDLGSYDLLDESHQPKTRPRGATDAYARGEDGEILRPAPSATDTETETDDEVGQVWSRWAEWWPTLLLMSAVVAAAACLLWFSFDMDHLRRTFAIVVGALLALLVLSYPMVITMERPVRVTPEQALKDYFAALSHWLPHYRRMWLLLSNSGRETDAYRTLPGFRHDWNRRLASLRASHSFGPGPLIFRVSGFKSEKSAGKQTIDARYTVEVLRSSGEGEQPVVSYRDAMRLVRGPDRMWYLTKGGLPEDAT